jgi:arsenite-transporting ATPase
MTEKIQLKSTSLLGEFVATATRFLFFAGKGGVGKTSLASATAVALADRGKRVLLVSTDPASNLEEVLGSRIGGSPTPIPGADGLFALDVDPQAAAQAYRDRVVGPYRDTLPEVLVQNMEEQLSGACTMEIAAFDEFSRLLGQPAATTGFDYVVFDTAPTGHTLRLLSLPTAWSGFLEDNVSGTSCLGPLAGLQESRDIYEKAVAALADKTRTTLVLVSRPQGGALKEAERTSLELEDLGVRNQRLFLNGVFRACCPEDHAAAALERRGASALEESGEFLARMQPVEIPLRAYSPVGIPALRMLLDDGVAGYEEENDNAPSELPYLESLSDLVDDLARSGPGVIMTMGKGGVGKTTLAAAIALELARRGLRVHLSTTDPAAHVEAAVGETAALEVSRIDPQVETRLYVDQVMDTTGKELDPDARTLLEEDLRSPCTEEIAVFRAFARVVDRGSDSYVVLDTAPTGHTLLLLDATEAYHREIARKSSEMPEEVVRLLPRLRDPRYTRVIIVTLPEATPVHEAETLQSDLLRAGIEPFAWVINQSFLRADTSDPVLVARGSGEVRFIHEVGWELSRRTAIVPWVPEEPVGQEKLSQLLV